MELLVVIAIIGTLVSLLLPAVQAARESARKITCQNNLRQIALGVINYTDRHDGRLPSLWKTDNVEPWQNFSWRVDVLPHLEMSALHDSLQLSQPPLASNNLAAVTTKVTLFQCPSTPNSPRLVESFGPVDVGPQGLMIGACDYSAMHDVANQESETSSPAAWRSRAESEGIEDSVGHPPSTIEDRTNPMLRTKSGNLKMVEDGLSQTALLVEQAGKPQNYVRAHKAEEVLSPEGAWATAEFSSFYAPGINVDNLTGIYGFHNGACVAMCDGSVQIFSPEMEPEVVTALLSRNGDEIIDSDDWR